MKYRKNINISKNKFMWSNRKVTLAWVMLTVFVAASVFFTIQTSTSGATLSYLESEEIKVIEENQNLKSEVVYLNSLKNLEEGAASLGFVKPQKIIYISEDEVVAKVP